MKRREFTKKALYGAAGIAAASYLLGCEKEVINNPPINPIDTTSVSDTTTVITDPIQGYTFKKRILSSGLESPGGLSVYKNSKTKSAPSSLEDLVFCSGPIFNGTQSRFLVPPSVFTYIGNLETPIVLYEFAEEDLNLFKGAYMETLIENGNLVLIDGEIAYRAVGTTSDTAVLADGTVLFSTTRSNKILDLTDGIKNIYLEDEELIGINNMIYGADEKIYLSQAAIREANGTIVRPKRVISLDSNKTLNVEFELPEGIYTSFGDLLEANVSSLYNGKYLERGTQVKIIENLDQELDPSKFYVLDQYSKAFYKVSGEGLVELLKNTDSYPSGMAAEINGKIYYVSPPIMYHPLNPNYSTELAFKPQLISLNPKDCKENVLYTFEGNNMITYNRGGDLYILEIDGGYYMMPSSFFFSMDVVQIDNNFVVYYADNISGELGEVSAEAIINP